MFRFFKKKTLKFLILPIIFFIGYKVNAVGIVYLTCDNNGCEVVNRCDNQYFCQSPLLNSNEIQFNFDNANFEIDSTYNFNLNFTTTSPALYGTPNIYDCNLAINGAFVVATRNSGRTGYECGSDRCDASFVSSMSYTMTQSLSNVPSFIRCQMNTTRYNYTQFTYSSNNNKGSVIKAINDNGNNQIQTANYNAQQNNSNRDSNTNRIIGKLGDVISGITNTGNDIVSGIVSGINSAKNFILNKMSDIITAIGDIVSPINTAIGNGVTGIVNKIGELIGTQEVCTVYYKTNGSTVEYGDSFQYGYLTSNGEIQIVGTSFGTSPYLPVSRSSFKYLANTIYTSQNIPNLYWCSYKSDKSLNGCYPINSNSIVSSANSSISFVRYSFPTNRGYTTSLSGDCQRTGLAGLFNKFTNFVRDFFNPDTSNAHTGFQGFIDKVADNDSYGGLQNIISSPLSMVNRMNSTCSSITIDIPYMQNNVQIPCMQSYLSQHLPIEFLNLVKLIVNGFVVYYGISSLLLFFHDLKDPHKDDLEVLEL